MVKITFLPGHKVIEVPEGSTILQAAVSAGEQIESTCGGRGTCGKCKVKVEEGSIAPSIDPGKKFISDEELKEGWVLACRVKVEKDLTVTLKAQHIDAHQRKTQLNQLTDLDIQPLIQKHFLKMPRPTVEDQRPDWDRLMEALPNGEVQFNRVLAVTLPKILHEANFEVTAVTSGNTLLAVEPGDTTGRSFGLAIDIGTTTTVAYLMDLNTGKAIASSALTNPQKAYGADVISRITHASKGLKELKQLQDLVIGGLNEIIADIVKQTGVKKEEIYEAVVVSNTTMSHLFMGIDPTYLAPAP
ncbi:MAG: 2Fe-2S iron-sulfur cluster binding domain-containing protein, partial [Desulfitobacterium sp.]|nr:2Fe-2S iron-sulfur cluster binding domain-containing protein [Desulfitobacterium sp.]